jgi:hypothetical protein
MATSDAQIRATLEAGRTAAAKGLRLLADQIESLPLDGAAEALSWLGDELTRLQREAARMFAGL